MALYSNSRISTFEQCPFKYKLHYIDKEEPEIPETIELFMGDLVHRTLEKFYIDRKFKKKVSKAILLKFFKDLWTKEYSKDILVVKDGLTAENYKKMALQYLSDYYDSYKNDDMTIIDVETKDTMTLPDGNQWHVRIDKLGCKGNNYFVCDYKTNARMKDQEEADSDRQLAMYSIWVKDKFKDAKKVILKWHMLAFNKEVTSERTDGELKKLQEDIVARIKQIEKATKEDNFPRNKCALCNYCEYKLSCPSFKHQVELAKKTIEQFKKDDGVKLVDTFADIKSKINDLEDQKEEFQDKLIQFAKQMDIDIVYGSNMLAKVKEFEKIVLPEDRDSFLTLMKKKGIYEECSMICYPKIQSKFFNAELDKEVSIKIKKEKDWKVSLAKRKDIEEE